MRSPVRSRSCAWCLGFPGCRSERRWAPGSGALFCHSGGVGSGDGGGTCNTAPTLLPFKARHPGPVFGSGEARRVPRWDAREPDFAENPMPRDKIILACSECKNRNYFTTKNKRLHPERVEWKKYCPRCNKHQSAQGNEVAMASTEVTRPGSGTRAMVSYYRDVVAEMKKVTWPDRDQIRRHDDPDHDLRAGHRRGHRADGPRAAGGAGPPPGLAASLRAAAMFEHRWYAVQTTSGHENKVQRCSSGRSTRIRAEPEARGIRQALVPTQEVVEIKNGKKVTVERKIFPGYVLVEMAPVAGHAARDQCDPGRDQVRGQGSRAEPLRDDEVKRLLGIVDRGRRRDRAEGGDSVPRRAGGADHRGPVRRLQRQRSRK